MAIQLTDFRALEEKHFGKPGTPERKAYEQGCRKEINKLILTRLIKKIKAKKRF